jgi:PAS domain S-box-containing protein
MQVQPVKPVTALAVIAISAIIFSITVLTLNLRERELRHSRLETVSMTKMLMEQTEQNVESVDLVLQGIQERLMTQFGQQLSLDSTPVHLLLNARVSGLHHLKSLFLVDAKGLVINSSIEMPKTAISVVDRNYFKTFMQGKVDVLFIDSPVRSRADNTWTLNLSRPIFGLDGKIRGVVVAAISIQEFENLYSLLELDYVRPIGVYSVDGALLASLPHRETMLGAQAPELTRETLPREANEIRSVRHLTADGTAEVFAIGRLAGYPLLIGVTDDEQLSLASWREVAIPIMLGGGLVCIFIACVALYLIAKLRNKEALSRALNVADERYLDTINSVMDAIVAIDESMHITLFNPSAEKMFGRAATDALGQHIELLIPESLRSFHRQHVSEFATRPMESNTLVPKKEVFGLRADGHQFPIDSTISRSWIGGKLQMTVVLRDATARANAESELLAANRQLRDLSASLQDVREQERTRISRELHDDLGQQLTGLKLSLSWLGSRVKNGGEITSEQTDEMRQQLDVAIASVRRIAAELRPRVLDDLDFAEALEWQTREFTKHSGLQVDLQLPDAHLIKDDVVSTALFRIVQEALTNVVRHARATSVEVKLNLYDNTFHLVIHDNGAGLDADKRNQGLGLVSMRERCVAIGAVFEIGSSSGNGTTVIVTIPQAAVHPASAMK